MSTFLAIDFETANQSRDSACAVGIAVGSGGRIVHKEAFLIRPPSKEFVFTYIHGLTWNAVKDAPTFKDLWPTLASYVKNADYLVAHNAPFDRSVLDACCAYYRLSNPKKSFECTVRIARSVFGCHPATLPDVCRVLNIPLKHHDAGSDAEACGKIMLEAAKRGWSR